MPVLRALASKQPSFCQIVGVGAEHSMWLLSHRHTRFIYIDHKFFQSTSRPRRDNLFVRVQHPRKRAEYAVCNEAVSKMRKGIVRRTVFHVCLRVGVTVLYVSMASYHGTLHTCCTAFFFLFFTSSTLKYSSGTISVKISSYNIRNCLEFYET